MKVTKNFDFDKLIKSDATAQWLNQWGNQINKSLQEGLDKGEDINGERFASGSDFTHSSTQDGHAHKRPLIRSGRLQKSIKKFPASVEKLTFWIKSNVKSKARWNLQVDGKKYSGTRSRRGVNYGAMHNQGALVAYKTSPDSFIANKNVESRIWFGIPKGFFVGGKEWNKMKTLIFYWDRAIKIKASRLGQ